MTATKSQLLKVVSLAVLMLLYFGLSFWPALYLAWSDYQLHAADRRLDTEGATRHGVVTSVAPFRGGRYPTAGSSLLKVAIAPDDLREVRVQSVRTVDEKVKMLYVPGTELCDAAEDVADRLADWPLTRGNILAGMYSLFVGVFLGVVVWLDRQKQTRATGDHAKE
jgi:hypothetical protein